MFQKKTKDERNAECRMQNAECKMQNAKLRIAFSSPFSVLIPLRGLFTASSRHRLQAASALDLIAAVRFQRSFLKCFGLKFG